MKILQNCRAVLVSIKYFFAHSWKSSIFRHRFRTSIIWGVTIELLLMLLHSFHFPIIDMTENWVIDTVMRLNATSTAADDRIPQFIYIDVNDTTWRDPSWGGGEPLQAPRNRISELINIAFQKGAKQVILDIVIDGRPYNHEDHFLAEQLENLLSASYFQDGQKLILTRTIATALPQEKNITKCYADEIRPSVLDKVIAKSQGRIAIAAPYFLISKTDHVLRDWELWRIGCRRTNATGGEWQVIPSVQLLAVAHHLNWSLSEAPWVLPTNIHCPLPNGEPEIDIKKPQVEINERMWLWLSDVAKKSHIVIGNEPPQQGSLSNRIVYHFGGTQENLNNKVSIVRVIPAIDAMECNESLSNKDCLKRHDLQNSIVIIGQSYHESHDKHHTPMGNMSGPLVILNSIDSMIRLGVLREPSNSIKLILSLTIIILSAFVAALCQLRNLQLAPWYLRYCTSIYTGTLLVVLFFASYKLFKYGIYLDLAMPIIGIWAEDNIKIKTRTCLEISKLVAIQSSKSIKSHAGLFKKNKEGGVL